MTASLALVKRARPRHGSRMSMSVKPGREGEAQAREQRLAAKLRENLHRRKAQARAQDAGEDTTQDREDDALPKAEGDR